MAIRMMQDGKTIVLDPTNDACLFSTYQPQGDNNSRWDEYYAHRSRSGKIYFYDRYTTLWQGEFNSIRMLSVNEMKEILEGRAFTPDQEERILEYIPDFFEEDA